MTNEAQRSEASASTDVLYVLAGTYMQAANLAMQHGLPSNRLRFIEDPDRLRGLDGKGKTLFVYGTAQERTDYFEILGMAELRGFHIAHI